MDFPIKLPPTRNLLYQPNHTERTQRTHPLQKLKLWAFRVSGRFCKAEEFRESSELIIQAWRQSTKKQYECYLREWLKFSGSWEIDPLQPSINVVIEFFYDLYKSGVQNSGIGTARSALSGFLSFCSEGQIDIGNSVFVKKFMRGVFALHKYRTAWNPDIVLNYFSSLS